jgi:multiple sugar transport system permease protein
MLQFAPLVNDQNRFVGSQPVSNRRKTAGKILVASATLGLTAAALVQGLYSAQITAIGFETWRPVLYMYFVWAAALCTGQILMRGADGQKALFVLPAVLFTVTDWNLSSLTGRHFNGIDNLKALIQDDHFWNAMFNMVYYVLAVLVQYAIAFGLALLLNAEIRARKFFRVAFLLPLMLSPVAVTWMIGKSIMEYRFGPAAALARFLGWDNPAFFASPWIARLSIMAMDAWVSIPFIMMLLLAGLQALPKEILEAAKVDGANAWHSFWEIVFPLMLPVSMTAIILRIIFELKLADIVINMTGGGPGGATDTVSSFIFREYRDRSNVGYGTMLAEVYFVIIAIFVSVLLNLTGRLMRKTA